MLDIQSNKKEYKFVGVKVPPRIHSYLTLYSLAKGTRKSKIIKDLIETWIIKQRACELDSVLIRGVALRINSQWMAARILNPQLSFSDFKDMIKDDLLVRGLSRMDTDLIIKELKEK